MARLFAGSPDKLLASSALVTGPPFTIAAWVIADVLGDDTVFSLGNTTESDHYTLRINSSGKARWRVEDISDVGDVTTTTTFSIGDLIHIAAVEETTSLRHVYLNGGGKDTNTNLITPAGIDEMGIGFRAGGDPGKFFNGTIGLLALYKDAFSDNEVGILAEDRHPLRVRRGDLVGLWALNGQSPEPNIMDGGGDMVVTGTTVVEELKALIGNHILAPG